MLESCALTVSSKALPAKPLMSNVVLTLPLAGVEPGIDTVAMAPEMDALLLLGVQEIAGMATSAQTSSANAARMAGIARGFMEAPFLVCNYSLFINRQRQFD